MKPAKKDQLSVYESGLLAARHVPTFAEQLTEAISVLVDAKIDYAVTRRSGAAEFANSDPVTQAEDRLQSLLGRVAA